MADNLTSGVDPDDSVSVLRALNRALLTNPTMKGLRFTPETGATLTSGVVPDISPDADATSVWLDNALLVAYRVEHEGNELGVLHVAFELDQLRAESEERPPIQSLLKCALQVVAVFAVA